MRVYLSFGAGVQSTALALLAINQDERLLEVTDGLLPSAAFFADTGDERVATYDHVWRMAPLFGEAGIAYHVVQRDGESSLSDHVRRKTEAEENGIDLPPFFLDVVESNATLLDMLLPPSLRSEGMARRGCTRAFKARPLDKYARRFFKADRHNPVEQWMGISRDEMDRMRDSDRKWKKHHYPLVWMGWHRHHCAEYVNAHAYADGAPIAAGRSACVYCPYHDNRSWREVQADPRDWDRAVAFDTWLRQAHEEHGRIAGLNGVPYLTRELLPLTECEFEDHPGQIDLFADECEGLCGI